MALMERALEGLGIGVGIDGSPAPEIDFCARAGLDRSMVAAFLSGQIDDSLLPEPAWGPIGKVVFERTYARDVPGEDRKETWAETVRRVVLGNLSYAPERLALPAEAEQLFGLLYSFSAIPAGRHLWVTGVPEISSMSRNCFVSGHSRRTSSHFRFLAARLFEGGGVGANYTNDLLAVTSPILGSVEVRFVCDRSHPDFEQVAAAAGDSLLAAAPAGTTQVVTVPDTREGWVDAWCAIIDLACQPGQHRLVLSVSALRPHGAPLRTFGGRASGPAPFVTASTSIARVLADIQGRRLSGLEAMTIDHHIASAVVAGGSRRSARLALMRWDDPDIFAFVDCKADQLSHWSANISVEIDAAFRRAVADGDPQATAVLRKVAEGMARNGEPGLIDTDLASQTEPVPLRAVNPCITGDTWVHTTAGLAQVRDLVGRQVRLVIDGEEWDSGPEGFFSTGVKPLLRIDVDGTPLYLTADHLVSTPDGWRAAGSLTAGDVVDISDCSGVTWGGTGTSEEGRLLGAYMAGRLPAPGLERPDVVQALASHYGASYGRVTIPDRMMSGSSDLLAGVLEAVFDAYATVEGRCGSLRIRLAVPVDDAAVLGRIRLALLSLGVRSAVRDGAVVLVGAHVDRFAKTIGFSDLERASVVSGHPTAHGARAELMVGTVRSVVPAGPEEVFDVQVPGMNAFVANGVIAHNCGESFLSADDGTFGVADGAGEACNLGSVDLARFGTDIAAAAAAVGLVARFLYRSTTNPHPDPAAGRIEAVNRRIGVGIMGLQGWVAAHRRRLSDLPGCPDLLGELTYLRVAARFAADELADALGTPRSVKVTAVAPTGTIAQLGGTTPGLHPCFARRFIRRVRFADSDPAWREEAAKGFRVLDDIYASNTKVVEYPMADTILDRWPERLIEQADEIGPAAFLDLIAAVQASYVGGFDGQAVSATAHVDPAEDPDRIVEIIAARLGKLKGFTLFPAASRDLAPYEAIDVETYERLRAALDVTASTVGDSNDGECEGSSCPIR